MPTKVTLRQKSISKGRASLYLDFYPPITHPKTGKPTRREFLGIYIKEKPKTTTDKLYNSENLKIANSIRQKRENILNKPEIYSEHEKELLKIKEAGEQCFLSYFEKIVNKKNGSNKSNWVSALKHLTLFTNGNLKFSQLNEHLMEDFKEYLLSAKSLRNHNTNLSQNSAVSYFGKVRAALKLAYRDGYLQKDLNVILDPIKEEETRREFLTLEELNRLAGFPCSNEIMKRAALFSALTGLRFSDIEKMVWKELSLIEGEGYYLNYNQQKTNGVETLPINEQAYGLTNGLENPDNMPPNQQVFNGLKYSSANNKILYEWLEDAGITKKITFHCFRHTFATLQLRNGTDIYTVSKLLGHKDLKTTQVYAKIVDPTKRDAVNKIKLDF